MGILDRINRTSEILKEEHEKKELQRMIKLKSLRDSAIPFINKIVEKYNGIQVKFLDDSAYFFIVEGGHERGVYFPYTITEMGLDLKLDVFYNNFESASKHRMKKKISSTMNSVTNIGDGETSGGNFWDQDVSLKSFNSSLGKRR